MADHPRASQSRGPGRIHTRLIEVEFAARHETIERRDCRPGNDEPRDDCPAIANPLFKESAVKSGKSFCREHSRAALRGPAELVQSNEVVEHLREGRGGR